MPNKTPRVSVLTPVYNTNPVHLREMIESILNQTFTDFEFLILNDSPDNADIEKIVHEYATRDKRIKYGKNDKNLGITQSRNKLLEMARGEYIAIFDHDDISVPDRLSRQVEYMDANPSVGVASGWLQYFGADNNIWKTPEFDADIRIMLCDSCYIAHTAAMIRKSVLDDNDIRYEEFYTPAEDYRLWARLMDVTHFYNMQCVLVKYRWAENNTSRLNAHKTDIARKNISCRIRDKHPGLYNEFRKVSPATIFRLRLFGCVPLLKIKNNTGYLFEILPIFKIKWR